MSGLEPLAVSVEKPVIVFDDNCKLCQKAVKFLKMNTKGTGFEFVPSFGLQANNLLDKYNIAEESARRTVILIDKGRIYMKSSAVIRAIIKKGSFWKIASIFFLIPASLRDAIYDWIAQRRNRL